MTQPALPLLDPTRTELAMPSDPDAGFGSLRTPSGNLPLESLQVRAQLTGLASRTVLRQRYRNPFPDPIEATYVFPLPDRGAVTALRMTVADRTVLATLREREQARAEYDAAIAAGRRAAIAEEERPDVFTLRVGNVLPGEQVDIELTVVGVLPVADDAATYRFPLVVAPRYIPGRPLPDEQTGSGHQPDTDAVPDASRISPPVLLPGFPNPVRLDIEVELDPAGLPMGPPSASLHAVQLDGGTIRLQPGERADRDFILRIPFAQGDRPAAALALAPDPATAVPEGAGPEGTFELTVLPPALSGSGRARDVVLLLDRSGSMAGWKVVAARRAAARIVDTLTDADRFAVLAFDHQIETPPSLPDGLLPGTDRNRFRAVEFLAGLDARGGTELDQPLARALDLLAGPDLPAAAGGPAGEAGAARDRVLVLVTDGQVGNEDQLVRGHAARLGGVRVHTVGIDRAVNAGFLGRLASLGGGRCELVESEDRLDEAMTLIHRRIGSPLVTGIELAADGLELVPDSTSPARLPDLFPGVPYLVRGRFRGAARGGLRLSGTGPDGSGWTIAAGGEIRPAPAITAAWARAALRDLEDRYTADADRFVGLGEPVDPTVLERRIVATSLRFGVLCRFTAFVAVDERVVTEGGKPRSVLQPVEQVSGWQPVLPPHAAPAPMMTSSFARPMSAMAAPPPGMRLRKSAGIAAAAPAAPAPLPAAEIAADLSGGPFGAPGSVAIPASGTVGSAGGGAIGSAAGGGDDADAAFVRSLLVAEAARLRALAGAADHVRREALLDLGSRLAPLDPGRLDPAAWRELLELVDAARPGDRPVGDLVEAVLRVLDRLTAAPDPSHQPPPSPKPHRPGGMKRPAFWKHHPER